MKKLTRRIKTVRKPLAKKPTDSARRKPTRKSASSKSAPAAYDRGAAGFGKAKDKRERQEEEYQRKKETPYDFRLKPGDEAEVVVLDNEEPFFVTLHKVKNNQGRWEDAVCIAPTGEACPLCSSTGKEGSYTMVLTVLDRRPYKIQNGPNAGKTIKVSKKLMMVKGRNLAKFERQYKRTKGAWRGLRINCARTGDKEAAIGEDLEFMGKVKEISLKKYGENSIPADYEKIFEVPSAAELAARYNLSSSVAGSEEFNNDDDTNLDGVSW
jgi:hypothetical protein